MTPDIEITGQFGFFAIAAVSEQGRRWMRAVEAFDGHQTYTDDTSCAADITHAAMADGLTVTVNGRRVYEAT